jgi:predicted MPP superfamily phosphohydrolase
MMGFLLVIDLYSFQALRILGQTWGAPARTAAYALFWSIPLVVLAYFFAYNYLDGDSWNRNAHTYLRTFIFIAYMSKMLVLPFLAIDDVRRAVQWTLERVGARTNFSSSRSRFLTQFGVLIGSIPFFSLTYGMIRNAYRYKLFYTPLEFDDLPDALHGLKIVQISDIHSGSFTFKEPVKTAIDLINAQKPDLVFFTGDLVNERADEMLPFLDVFDKIESRHGVYSIVGNHDYGDYVEWPTPEAKTANFESLKDMHRRLGWDLLLNENRVLDIRDTRLAVIGVENYSAHLRFPRHGDLKKASIGTETADFKVLLSHDPSHWDVQVNKDHPDIRLMLSGHTHGMQFGVEIPGWLKWSPIKYLYKQWAGLYQKDQQYLYVNRGLGFLGYPGRVGILPEIACLELRKKGATPLG